MGSKFASPIRSGCSSAFNSLGQCTHEPCNGKKCEFIKPKEFLGGGPRTLTPADFGYEGRTVEEEKDKLVGTSKSKKDNEVSVDDYSKAMIRKAVCLAPALDDLLCCIEKSVSNVCYVPIQTFTKNTLGF